MRRFANLESLRRRTRSYDVTQGATIIAALQEHLPPAGFIMASLTAQALPSGWLACDGASYPVETYPDLFDAIGYTYGGSGASFTMPDGADLILMGSGSIVQAGQKAGARDATLDADNMPAHSHNVNDPKHAHAFTGNPHDHAVTNNDHQHSVPFGTSTLSYTTGGDTLDVAVPGGTTATSADPSSVSVSSATAGGTVSESLSGVTVQDTGGGKSFPIIPPVLGVRFAIKT